VDAFWSPGVPSLRNVHPGIFQLTGCGRNRRSRRHRAERIGTFWGHPETRTFGELLIDLEEDKAARAVVFGLLAEMERR
jgi:hypothetical protein